jgi:hypothetical protein
MLVVGLASLGHRFFVVEPGRRSLVRGGARAKCIGTSEARVVFVTRCRRPYLLAESFTGRGGTILRGPAETRAAWDVVLLEG